MYLNRPDPLNRWSHFTVPRPIWFHFIYVEQWHLVAGKGNHIRILRWYLPIPQGILHFLLGLVAEKWPQKGLGILLVEHWYDFEDIQWLMTTEDEMTGWHHWLDGRESEWTPGVGDGQGGLACCDSWGRKESDTTERLNWTELSDLWFRVSSVGSTYSSFSRKMQIQYSAQKWEAPLKDTEGTGVLKKDHEQIGHHSSSTAHREYWMIIQRFWSERHAEDILPVHRDGSTHGSMNHHHRLIGFLPLGCEFPESWNYYLLLLLKPATCVWQIAGNSKCWNEREER